MHRTSFASKMGCRTTGSASGISSSAVSGSRPGSFASLSGFPAPDWSESTAGAAGEVGEVGEAGPFGEPGLCRVGIGALRRGGSFNVGPMPSWPCAVAPNPKAAPSVQRKTTCSVPAAIARTRRGRASQPPCGPKRFQATRFPSSSATKVLVPPAANAIGRAPLGVASWTSVGRDILSKLVAGLPRDSSHTSPVQEVPRPTSCRLLIPGPFTVSKIMWSWPHERAATCCARTSTRCRWRRRPRTTVSAQ
mmetsp:Transcript_14893/g.42228  ORF Transcript_14893/g.42228 Transcript_14893/m.42228 type:complete len:249 (-) Transcript_14893:144-890(-)